MYGIQLVDSTGRTYGITPVLMQYLHPDDTCLQSFNNFIAMVYGRLETERTLHIDYENLCKTRQNTTFPDWSR